LLFQIEDYIPVDHPVGAQQESVQRFNTQAGLSGVSISEKEVSIRHPPDNLATDGYVKTGEDADEHFSQGLFWPDLQLHALHAPPLGDFALLGPQCAAVFDLLEEDGVLFVRQVGKCRP
jgi:hypothetical protein